MLLSASEFKVAVKSVCIFSTEVTITIMEVGEISDMFSITSMHLSLLQRIQFPAPYEKKHGVYYIETRNKRERMN